MKTPKTLSTADLGTLNDALHVYEKARGAEEAERLRDAIGTAVRGQRELESRYRFGVAWIARNDDASCVSVKAVARAMSTLLLADMFRRSPSSVAKEIVAIRTAEAATEAKWCKTCGREKADCEHGVAHARE